MSKRNRAVLAALGLLAVQPVPQAMAQSAAPAPDWSVADLTGRLAAIERILAPIISLQETTQREIANLRAEIAALHDAQDRAEQQAAEQAAAAPAAASGKPPVARKEPAPRMPAPAMAPVAADAVAATPETYLENARKDVARRDWKAAQVNLETFLSMDGQGPSAIEARYWLGRSFHGQGRFPEAAALFLKGYQDGLPGALKLENLYYLGLSLEGMGGQENDQLCALYDEAMSEFKPDSDAAIIKAVTEKRIAKGC